MDFQRKVLKRILLILKFLHSAFVDFGLNLKHGVDQYFGHFGESEELGRSFIYLTPDLSRIFFYLSGRGVGSYLEQTYGARGDSFTVTVICTLED